LNARFSEDSTTTAKHAMARAIGRRADPPPEGAAISSGWLTSAADLVPVDQANVGGVQVAVVGQVSWESEELVHVAQASGAAAAVARAYELHGADCVKRFHGPFELAIVDERRQRGLLAIDRMAIRTMFFARTAGGVVFGTTADSVVAHPAIARRLSTQGIYNYLYCENVPGPGTIYEGVSKLLPGQRLIVEGARADTDFYWQLDYNAATGASEAALREEFRRLLRDCVARSATTESIGAFLSGGTDSSTVTGMLTRVRGGPVDTYSIGFEAEGFDEMEYARITSQHFGSRAHEYYVTPGDVAKAIPLIAAAYDEPFGNASAVPTYYCAKLAKDDGRQLLLAGDGGDEIFGGNARYAKQKVFEWYGLVPSALRRGLVEPVLFSGDWVEHIGPLRKARSYVQQARVPLPDRLEAYNFLEREVLADIFEPEFLRAVDPHQPRAIAREVYHRTTSPAVVNRMMHFDLKQTLADNDLRKVNRMCELAGIEVRYPLLDDELVAFSGRLTPSQKVHRLKLRHFFKEALSDFLPPETITKSKHGFGLPFGLWMERDASLRELADESLTAFSRRGYVKLTYVDRLLHQHQTTHASYFGVMIWIVMMLERWLAAHEA
jgi:asparagine synthase (glutamine-hydrolysing)